MHPYPLRTCLQGLEVELFELVSTSATPEQWEEWLRALFKLVSTGATPEQWGELLRVPLEHAAARGNLDLVNRLLQAGANAGEGWRGCHGRTLLDAAAVGGNADVVSALVRAGAGKDVNVVSDASGRSALYTATYFGHQAAARQLILAGADVNFQDPVDKFGVLHTAVRRGYERLVNDLLRSGVDVNERHVVDGYAPLHFAAGFGFGGIVSALMLADADKNARDNDGDTPLIVAVVTGRLAVVEILVAAGADLEMRNTADGWTAVHYAVAYGREEILSKLLSIGADKNARDNEGNTPLLMAATKDRGVAVETLVAAGADLHLGFFSNGWTPLHSTAAWGNEKMVAKLLSLGADKNARDDEGNTPLMTAVEAGGGVAEARGQLAVVKTLLAAGADFSMHNTNEGCTALHFAAYFGHGDIVAILLSSGADKHALDSDGTTPLMWAAGSNRLDAVEKLVAAGADLDMQSGSDGSTALHQAATEGHDKVMAALLLNGANAKVLSNNGRTPLMMAAAAGHLGAVETLLKAGVELSTPYAADGQTPLHDAAYFGYEKIVAALLSMGADKDVLDNEGYTPLMSAAGEGHVAAVETLLAADADLTRRTLDGLHLSAFDLAALNGRTRVMEVFLRHGQDIGACSDETGRATLHAACYYRPEGLHGVVDLLLKHGADETALDKNGDRPVDKLDIPLDEEELGDSPPCAQDEVERARLRIARASADRAWRRRSWLVMLRSRAAKATGEEQGRTIEGCNAVEGLVRTAPMAGLCGQGCQERGGVGKLGWVQHGVPGGTAGCSIGFVEEAVQAASSLSAVVDVLVGLSSEGLFRAVVIFL
eukprot:g16662.t1